MSIDHSKTSVSALAHRVDRRRHRIGRENLAHAYPERSPEERARILALFQLGLMGGAPVGAVLIGYLAALAGPRGAVVYPSACMLLVLAGLLLRSRLWQQGEAREAGQRIS